MAKKPSDTTAGALPKREGRPEWIEDNETAPVRVEPLPSPHETVPCLVVIAGTQLGQVLPMKGRRAVIGRDETAELSIHEPSISRRHAVVYKDEEEFCRIKDLGSRNGTFVNGRRIQDVILTAADRIQVGKTVVIKFEYHSKLEKQFLSQLYEAGTLDPLTGIYNRRYFDGHFAADFRLCVRHKEPLSLLMIDIDHFKRVNDTDGHPAGDAVLRQLAVLLGGRLRTEDILARYGGEEFVIILRRTDAMGARALAGALRGLIESTDFVVKEKTLKITVTIGVATWTPNASYDTNEALLEAADKALYRAKELGRNCVETDR